MAHVVAHVQARAGVVGGPQDRVAVLDGDREGLLHEDRVARAQGLARQVRVGVVGGQDEQRVEVRVVQERAVVGERLGAGEASGGECQCFWVGVGHRGDPRAVSRPVGGEREVAAQAEADDAQPQIVGHEVPPRSDGLHGRRGGEPEGRRRVRGRGPRLRADLRHPGETPPDVLPAP
ncbi:hypothetical protein SRIMM317S_00050 [Streptomyces rimosus subsp. rimosus]